MGIDRSPRTVIAAVERQDVLLGLEEINRESVPPRQRSRKFCLAHEGRHYPPKLAISFASAFRYANEPEMHEGLDPADFAGGPQSNKALHDLGFKIEACDCGGIRKASRGKGNKRGDGPRLARVVVDGRAGMTLKRALKCLDDVFRAMRKAEDHADIVVTPGGFIVVDLKPSPQILGWDTPPSALLKLTRELEPYLKPFVADLEKLQPLASYITLGIDCALPDDEHQDANAQLVATVKLPQ